MQVYLNQTEEPARSINIKRIFPGEGGEDSGETVKRGKKKERIQDKPIDVGSRGRNI